MKFEWINRIWIFKPNRWSEEKKPPPFKVVRSSHEEDKVIMGYNCGINGVKKNKIPKSTKIYLEKVHDNLEYLKALWYKNTESRTICEKSEEFLST